MLQKTEIQVLKTFQRNNPSFYYKTNKKNVNFLKKKIEDLFFYKLKFPLENFQDKKLLEFGCGSGQRSLIYNFWSKKSVHVDFDKKSILNAQNLFKRFSNKKNFKFFESSINEFFHNEKFDIVLSEGVLHHHKNPYSQFKKCQKFLKKGGYFILGVANNAGCFQRMLARQSLYVFSKNQDEIIENAKILFSDFLKRSHKYSGRKIEDIIADIFIVPIWKPISIKEIESWFKKNNFKLFNSYPNFIKESYFADSHNLPSNNLNLKFSIFSELIWMTHRDKDKDFINFNLERYKNLTNFLEKFLKNINGTTFKKKIDLNKFLKDTKNIQKSFRSSNLDLMDYFDIKTFFLEMNDYIKILKEKDIYKAKKFIKKSKILFKGTNGIGINYYIGKK